jgi:hypothetical protein
MLLNLLTVAHRSSSHASPPIPRKRTWAFNLERSFGKGVIC